MTSRRMRVSVASLDLDERGDGVLVEKQVVERPSTRPVLFAGDGHLTGDEQPTPRLLGVDLVPGEQIRVIRQELLQEALRVVRRLLHRDQLGIFFQKVDATSHMLTCVQLTPVVLNQDIVAFTPPTEHSPLHTSTGFSQARHFCNLCITDQTSCSECS